MILLDTHAWVWWIFDDERLSPVARERIDTEDEVAVSAISFWEVSLLASKGRLDLRKPAAEWLNDADAMPGVKVVPLSATAAATAGDDAWQLHNDPADRFIAATAWELAVPLVTRDERLRAFEHIQTIW